MNRFIFDTLAFLNALLAIMIILGGAAFGWASSSVGAYALAATSRSGMQIFGAILGGLGGLAVAALICGTIAFFALIENHLRVIAQRGSGESAFSSNGLEARSEPRA